METEIDLGLDLAQWETLKALGAPNPDYRRMNQLAFQQLVAQELAAMLDGHPIITPMGRKVVVRGSPQLWGRSARGRAFHSSGQVDCCRLDRLTLPRRRATASRNDRIWASVASAKRAISSASIGSVLARLPSA